MSYEDLKNYAENNLGNVSKLQTMKSVIENSYKYFTQLEKKLVHDLSMTDTNRNVSVASTGNMTGTLIGVNARSLTMSYEDNDYIRVMIYEPGVIQETIDILSYVDGKVIRKNGNVFETNNIDEYLNFFSK